MNANAYYKRATVMFRYHFLASKITTKIRAILRPIRNEDSKNRPLEKTHVPFPFRLVLFLFYIEMRFSFKTSNKNDELRPDAACNLASGFHVLTLLLITRDLLIRFLFCHVPVNMTMRS